MRWHGRDPLPRRTATYTFFTKSDDGSQLFVDGKLVVDNGGLHAMRERQGQLKLTAGDHDLRVDFIQGEGEAGCIMSWAFDGREKEIVPADVFFHRPRAAQASGPRRWCRAFSPSFSNWAERWKRSPMWRPASLTRCCCAWRWTPGARWKFACRRPPPWRRAWLASNRRCSSFCCPAWIRRTRRWSGSMRPKRWARRRLDDAQLKALCGAVAQGGVLEVPKLLQAFEQSARRTGGRGAGGGTGRSAGLKSLRARRAHRGAAIVSRNDPSEGRAALRPTQRGPAKNKRLGWPSLQDVLAGGEIQRGRDLFFGNKKAICATCHAAQGQGGKIGPDLSKIGAIRTHAICSKRSSFPATASPEGTNRSR